MTKCDNCQRERTDEDALEYSPVDLLLRRPLGWYSGDDGEICGDCMTRMIARQ